MKIHMEIVGSGLQYRQYPCVWTARLIPSRPWRPCAEPAPVGTLKIRFFDSLVSLPLQ